MKNKKSITLINGLFLLIMMLSLDGFGWSEHPLLVSVALKDRPVWKKMPVVEARSLRSFLSVTEKELADFLAIQEQWSRMNLPSYDPCPDELAFRATGNTGDILNRFFAAIRINPDAKIPLYLHLLPNDSTQGRPVVFPSAITTLKDTGVMVQTTYVRISEGEMVAPFDVLCTANDEPDYGFDIGLFDDNHTDYGKLYGFGPQPFGNPNLEYSSLAPFHMAFYHEAPILYRFGAFLKKTHLDYRIFLYKALSEFAFRHNQPYWGWRFMGWGMHYMGDVSMPYHMKPLPGVSTFRMIGMSLASMLGFPKMQANAVQLVSNRHTLFEEFEQQVLRKALLENDHTHPFLVALTHPGPDIPFSYDFLLHTASAESARKAKKTDQILRASFPRKLVCDPEVEAGDMPETDRILQVIYEQKGEKAVDAITGAIAGHMMQYGINVRSYMDAVIKAAAQ